VQTEDMLVIVGGKRENQPQWCDDWWLLSNPVGPLIPDMG
jgi:hypothetical protein